jgi:hypothetical protein
MTKTLNQIIIFFPPPKSEYFFQQRWESDGFFLEKTHNPPFKLNGRSLIDKQKRKLSIHELVVDF